MTQQRIGAARQLARQLHRCRPLENDLYDRRRHTPSSLYSGGHSGSSLGSTLGTLAVTHGSGKDSTTTEAEGRRATLDA